MVELFGPPVATIRDMGKGCAGAVKQLREEEIPDLICHYHFASAIGKRLMESLYDRLKHLIRVTQVRANLRVLLRDLRSYRSSQACDGRFGSGHIREDLKVLILWLLEGKGRKDAPFPFGVPHLEFVRRIRQTLQQADAWVPCPRTAPERRAISHLTASQINWNAIGAWLRPSRN